MPGVHTFYDGSSVLQPLSDLTGVEVDKINFVVCMATSLPLAIIYNKYLTADRVSRQIRTLLPLLVGLSFCFFCFGRAVKHLLANCLISYFFMYQIPAKHVHRVVFAFSMGYLLLIHFYRWLILSDYRLDITGPIMVTVQKITSLAFSLHDGKTKKKEDMTDIQRREAITEVPSLLDYMSFIFNFQTVLTGPLLYYTDYISFLEGTHIPKNKTGQIPSADGAAIRKVGESMIYLFMVVVFAGKYKAEHLMDSDYLALPLYQWLFWWFTTIFLVRTMYYFAWIFADAVCNFSGLGFSGFDSDGNAKWELCTNVKPMQVELAQSFKETLDGWNICTMGWLRRVAYDRTPKKIRTMATYVLSATWHGISIGYYLTFFTGALFTLSGATFRRCMRWRVLDCHRKKFAYDIMSFIATKIALAYATYPFVTMNYSPAMDVYGRVYFIVHIVALANLFILPKYFKSQKKVEDASSTGAPKIHSNGDSKKEL